MDRRDDLALMITEKLQMLSSGIDEKINNAALQAKVVSDLSSAVRSHLVKISEIASSGADPQAIIQSVNNAVVNLGSALKNEEDRVKANYNSMAARKAVLAEVGEVVNEEIDSHKHWLQKKVELQQRHLSGENLLKPKKGQHPESVRDVRNALEDLQEHHTAEPETQAVVEPEPNLEEQLVQIHEPEASQDDLAQEHMELPAEPVSEPQEEQEPPQHVSRFFSGE